MSSVTSTSANLVPKITPSDPPPNAEKEGTSKLRESGLSTIFAIAAVVGLLFSVLDVTRIQHFLHLNPRVVDVVGKGLEAAALAFAVATLFDGLAIRRHERQSAASLVNVQNQLQTSVTHLERIGDALSTRYAGSFPGYLKDVKRLLRQSKSRVRVMCDFVGHGSFTDPDNWEKVAWEAELALKGHTSGKGDYINERNASVTITVLCAQPHVQKDLLEQQFRVFSSDTLWSDQILKRGDSDLSELVRKFDFKPSGEFETWTRSDFLTQMEKQEASFINKLRRLGAHVKRTESPLPFYLWIQDDTEAIFAFPTHTEAIHDAASWGVATAFWTQDQYIVNSLRETFDRLYREMRSSD
jgi:hypothetical protein